MHSFSATLQIIGINPFVLVPAEILEALFEDAGKETSPIPVWGTLNGKAYTQNLMRFKGIWRLYVNTTMLKDSPRKIGQTVVVEVAFDGRERTCPPHPEMMAALMENGVAKQAFDTLTPSKQKEIMRYLNNLKTPESVSRNVVRALAFLLGKGSFVGRQKP